MSAGGPQPSARYVERSLLTRSPSTPVAPSGLTSNNIAFNGQNISPEGTPRVGDGLVLAGLFAITVSVFPWVGQTLTGTGSLLCWIYNPYAQRWSRMPSADIDLSALPAAAPGYTSGAFWDPSRLGYIINWYPSSVAVSGGTDILLDVAGFMSTGPRST